MRFLRLVSDVIEHSIARMCALVATYVAYKPKKTLLLALVFVALLSTGWLRFRDEDNPEKLYAPQDTKAFRDRQWFEDRFDDAASPSNVLIDQDSSANLLSRDSLLDLFRLFDYIKSLDAFDGKYGYDERYCQLVSWEQSNNCQKDGILALWDWNRTTFELDQDVLATINNASAIADCCSPSTRTVEVERVAAKLRYDENGRIVSAGSLRLAFYLQNDINDKSREDTVTVRLERKFDRRLRNDFDNSPSWDRLLPITPAGVSDNVSDAFDSDRLFINLSFVFIIAYAFLALYKRRSPKSRGLLGLCAVLTVMLSVSAAFGIAIACGVIFSATSTIAMYLVLGIGLDDAFVICGAEDNLGLWQADVDRISKGQESVDAVAARRVVAAMAAAGPSITITSITDFFAFLAGSITRIPAINAFCKWALAAILARRKLARRCILCKRSSVRLRLTDNLLCRALYARSSWEAQTCCCEYEAACFSSLLLLLWCSTCRFQS